ncbi:MAG: hypothetical protein K0Q90_2731 [Paenibacillaceae bacterium]|nr:hypothetical protein [Paenibacillaceae bacterium]
MKAALTFSDLESTNLSWLCIEPMLTAVRGKDPKAKREMYYRLNEGQQALYLFYSFHNHTQTAAEFYWFSAYNIHELKAWGGIRSGVLYFQDETMAGVLDETGPVLAEAAERHFPASPSDLELDPKLASAICRLHARYRICSEQTIQLMNVWVLAHRESYLELIPWNE